MNKSKFIDLIKGAAQRSQEEYGILASLTVSQAILESGWGSSELSIRAYNLFGIKAFTNWTGKRVTMATTECYDGKKVTVNAEFRAYDSYADSIEDHSKLLTNSRYRLARECKDYRSACQKIYECGYATDPGYPQKLIRIIEENRLYEYDDVSGVAEAAADMDSERIKKFQHLCNLLKIRDDQGKPLKEDNALGPRTRSCISKMPVLKTGSKGQAVEFVQEIVKAEPTDGDFGPITQRCVKEFQKLKNIQVDGIVGHQTWAAIIA